MPRCLLVLISIFFFFSSCQKEKSLEMGQVAQGSLQSDLGDCLPKKVSGAYVVSQSLTDSNYIDVTLDIAKPGRFTIITDTVNGYFFKSQGNFTTAGTNTVRLKGSGKPVTASDDVFTVSFDSSSCFVEINVMTAGSSGGTAVYSLNSTTGNCTSFNVAGTYTQGATLVAANTVTLSVNVTTPGSWAMSTTSVTGFLFSGSGTFSSAGVQTIILSGIGIPTTVGDQIFSVSAGTSSCNFSVAVVGGSSPPPATGVYFPLTANSWWTYDDGAGSDSVKVVVNGTGTFLGNTYQRFITSDASGPLDTSYYRKDNASGAYYMYTDTSGFGAIGVNFTQAGIDVLFLKDALTTGAVFNSDHQAMLLGQPVTIRFNNTVVDANASITVNGKTFTNVYKIELKVQLGSGGVFQDISLAPLDYYYAKDIGLIKITDGTNSQDIRYWKIN